MEDCARSRRSDRHRRSRLRLHRRGLAGAQHRQARNDFGGRGVSRRPLGPPPGTRPASDLRRLAVAEARGRQSISSRHSSVSTTSKNPRGTPSPRRSARAATRSAGIARRSTRGRPRLRKARRARNGDDRRSRSGSGSASGVRALLRNPQRGPEGGHRQARRTARPALKAGRKTQSRPPAGGRDSLGETPSAWTEAPERFLADSRREGVGPRRDILARAAGREGDGGMESGMREEDFRFLSGRGRYADDVTVRGQAHAVVFRSPVAHARIASIDLRAARRAPGVLAVLADEDAEKRDSAASRPRSRPSAATARRASSARSPCWRGSGSGSSASRSRSSSPKRWTRPRTPRS